MSDSFVVNFYLKNSPISGKIVVLKSLLRDAYLNHGFTYSTQKLVALNTALVAVVGNSIKYPAIVTSQVQSANGAPKYLVSELYSHYKIRTFARLEAGENFVFDNSFLVLTVDWEEEKQRRYQSVIKIESDNFEKVFDEYFMQSQQTPTKIKTYFNQDAGSDYPMLSMISIERNPYNENNYSDDPWEKAQIFFSTIRDQELVDLDKNYINLLKNVFPEDEVVFANFTEFRWECKCSHEGFKNILKQMNFDELKELESGDESLEIECNYCGKEYFIKTTELTD
jgi:molecular chaperone Hsp33